MLPHERRAVVLSALVFLLLFFINISSNTLPVLKNVSKASAVTATLLIAVTLFLGPLSRFFPGYFKHDLIYRKFLGLSGFFFALLHALAAFVGTYKADIFLVFSVANPNFYPAVFGAIGLLVLFALAATSTAHAIKKLTFNNWKFLQRLGYLSLVFVVLHFVFVGNGYFLKSVAGQALLVFSFMVVVAKLLAIAAGLPKEHSKEEIKHLTKS